MELFLSSVGMHVRMLSVAGAADWSDAMPLDSIEEVLEWMQQASDKWHAQLKMMTLPNDVATQGPLPRISPAYQALMRANWAHGHRATAERIAENERLRAVYDDYKWRCVCCGRKDHGFACQQSDPPSRVHVNFWEAAAQAVAKKAR